MPPLFPVLTEATSEPLALHPILRKFQQIVAFFYEAARGFYTHFDKLSRRTIGCTAFGPDGVNGCVCCAGAVPREVSHFAAVAYAETREGIDDIRFSDRDLPAVKSAFTQAILFVPQSSVHEFRSPDIGGKLVVIAKYSSKLLRTRRIYPLEASTRRLPPAFDLNEALSRHLFRHLQRDTDPAAPRRKKPEIPRELPGGLQSLSDLLGRQA